MAWRLEQSAVVLDFLHAQCYLVVDISVFKYCVWPRDPSLLQIEFKITHIVTRLPLLFISFHLHFGINFGFSFLFIRFAMVCVRVATGLRGSSHGGQLRGIHAHLVLLARHGCWYTKHQIKTIVMRKERVMAEFQSRAVSRCRPAVGSDWKVRDLVRWDVTVAVPCQLHSFSTPKRKRQGEKEHWRFPIFFRRIPLKNPVGVSIIQNVIVNHWKIISDSCVPNFPMQQ